MTAQKGRDLLLKVDSSGTSNFITIAGLRTRTLAFNSETVDITHSQSIGQWRELLEGAGVRRARITGAGIFKDEASDASLKELFFAGSIRNWQVIIPDFGTITGLFQISALEYIGTHNGELTFDLALESAGSISFVAL